MTSRRGIAWLLGLLPAPFIVARATITAFLPSNADATPREAAAIWWFGAVNDLIAVALLLGLVALAAAASRRALRVAVSGALCVALVTAIVDLFFWFEFGSRTDRLVFHYLVYPVEILVFLQEQFHLTLIALPVVVAVALIHRGARPIADALAAVSRRTCAVAALTILLPLSSTLALEPEAIPLRPTLSRAINEAASNGLVNVMRAAFIEESRWSGVFPELPAVRRAALLHPPVRLQTAHDRHPRNVVLVVEESLGGAAWWNLDMRARYMPELDALRTEGLYFDRMYATGSRTTRGLEALLHGYPPLPGIALNQRTGFEGLPSLPQALAVQGLQTVFVYGGWPGFSNFANYWRNIGFAEVLTRDDFTGERFETSWGVADEVLFDRILQEMDRRTEGGKRVFLATLTTSNHRPFDFPEGRIAYSGSARKLEYATAYADWALGRFMAAAASRSWYADTLFVIVSDHGPHANGDVLIPVASFRIPALLIWPGTLAPGERHDVASQVDLPRTILGMFGAPGDEFFGRDLLGPEAKGAAPMEHDYRLGLLTDAGLTVLMRSEEPVSFAPGPDGRWVRSETDAQALELAIAVFQTAFERWSLRAASGRASGASAAAARHSDRAASGSPATGSGG